MLSHTTSTPQMCRPTICAAAMARAATSGCTSSVTSVAVPPVLRLALLRRMTRRPLAGIDSGVSSCTSRRATAMSSKRILVSEVAWPSPRRGSWLTMSTSSRTVCRPSPTTCGGSRREAATSLLPTTSRRKSLPGKNFSTMTVAEFGGGLVGAVEVFARGDVDGHALALVAVLRLDTTGRPTCWAAAQASSGSVTGGPAAPARRRRAAAFWSGPCPGRWIRRRRWWRRSRRPGCGAVWLPQPNCTMLPLVRRRIRNAARHGGVDDRAGAGAQALVFVEVAQLGDRGVEVEGCVAQRGVDQLPRPVQRQAADVFFAVLDDDLVGAAPRRWLPCG
jgi:hypothetical protein